MPCYCTRCGADVPALLDHRLASQTCEMLLECPHCHALADPWVELDRTVIGLDMILQSRAVYRHLLLNTRKDGVDAGFYARSTARLLGLVVLADTCACWHGSATAQRADLRWSDHDLSVPTATSLGVIALETVIGALCVVASAHRTGWIAYIALACATAYPATRRRERIAIIPQALAMSAVPCLGVLTFALLWRDAFAGSASTLVRNAAERLDLLSLVHRYIGLTPDQLVLREAELKWLLVRFGVGGTSAVCAMSGPSARRAQLTLQPCSTRRQP